MPVNYDLAKNWPGEYARIIVGLCLPEGRVELVSGTELRRVADAIPRDQTGRSIPERLLQSALRDMVSGPGVRYSNEARGDVCEIGDQFLHEGMTLERTAQVMEHIYNRDFSVYRREFYSSDDLLKLLDSNEFRYASVSLDWDETNDAKRDESSGHTLMFLKREGDRVYLRNSHQIWYRNGTELEGPTRRIEHASEGLISMSVEQTSEE